MSSRKELNAMSDRELILFIADLAMAAGYFLRALYSIM